MTQAWISCDVVQTAKYPSFEIGRTENNFADSCIDKAKLRWQNSNL